MRRNGRGSDDFTVPRVKANNKFPRFPGNPVHPIVKKIFIKIFYRWGGILAGGEVCLGGEKLKENNPDGHCPCFGAS